MPNYCNNYLHFDGTRAALIKLADLIKSDKNEFDFEKIVPMPDYIYRGGLGAREKEIYGENNWYDWSIKNWGTKWNSVDAAVFDNEISFLTAWSPCEPVIAALAKIFPTIRFTYTFYEPGMCFCGKRVYENGGIIFYFDGNYADNPACDRTDERANDYLISDDMFPIKNFGFNGAVQNVEEVGDELVRGDLHYREYEFGKIHIMADGWFLGTKTYTSNLMEDLAPLDTQAA